MKHFKRLSLIILPLLIISCGMNMIEQDTKPEIKPVSDKAVLVVLRTTSFGFAVVMDTYLDGKLIGQTQGKCYFITKVDPGEHYLMGESENIATAKINFEAGKVYYLNQDVFMGVMKARTGWEPKSPEFAIEQIPECDYLVYDVNNPGDDLDEDDYQEAIEDFEEEVKDDPERHINTLEYTGY
jgi:hypothetical protein